MLQSHVLKASQQRNHMTRHLCALTSPHCWISRCLPLTMLSLRTGPCVGLHVPVTERPAPGSTLHIPEGKVVSVAETVSTAERPCEQSAPRLYSSLSEHPANPALPHPQLLDFCEQLALGRGPPKKKGCQFNSQLGSVQPFSHTLSALHLYE